MTWMNLCYSIVSIPFVQIVLLCVSLTTKWHVIPASELRIIYISIHLVIEWFQNFVTGVQFLECCDIPGVHRDTQGTHRTNELIEA